MDLDIFNHRDYQLGGVIVVLIVLFLILGLSLTSLLVFAPLTFGAGYLFWRSNALKSTCPETSTAYGRTYDASYLNNSPQETIKQSGKKRRWKVSIGEEHTPSSTGNSSEEMDRSGLRGSLLTASILSPGTRSRRGLQASPVAQSPGRRASMGLSPGPGSSGMPLPRVRRVHDSSYSEGSSILSSPTQRLSILSPGIGHNSPTTRRYPTHQPKYAGLGLMPPVHLQGPNRRVLSDRNTSMLTSPVTVKVAPPDILKPPIPSIVPVEEASNTVTGPQHNPCNTEHVLSAIREKRKRTMKEEEVSMVLELRENKRRCQHAVTSHVAQEEDTGGNPDDEASMGDVISMETAFSMGNSLKRPAISRSREASIVEMEEQMVKRSRSTGPAIMSPATPTSTGQGRNPIEVSYSSSKRWLEKKQELEKTEGQRVKKQQTRSQSQNQSGTKHDTSDKSINDSLSISESVHTRQLSPRRVLSLVDQDTPMTDASGSHGSPADEPVPPTSHADTVTDEAENGAQTPDVSDVRTKLFPLQRDSSSRRRHTQIRSDSNTDEFSKVPTLRYSLTSEDYEKDRASEMKRVEQMLDDVEEAHAAKTATKTENKSLEAESTKSSATSLSTSSAPGSGTTIKITPLPSTVSTIASTGLLGTSSTTTALKVDNAKLHSVTSPLTLGSLTSSSNDAALPSSSQSALSTQSMSTVTSVTSISKPLLQTGAAASAASGPTVPASTSVISALQFASPATSLTPQATTGGGLLRLATPISQTTTATDAKLAEASAPATSEYSFPPLFSGTTTSTSIISPVATMTSIAAATSTVRSQPPPAYNSLANAAGTIPTGGLNFGSTVVPPTAPVSSTLDGSATAAAPFSFGIASATTTSAPSSTASSTPGFSFNATSFGTPSTSAASSSITAATSSAPSFNFAGGTPASMTQATTFGAPIAVKPITSIFGGTSLPSSTSGFGSTLSAGVSAPVAVLSTTAFGTSAVSTTPAFSNTTGAITTTTTTTQFGAPVSANTSTTSSGFSFGGSTGQAGKVVSPFGEPSSTMFGQAGSTTTTGRTSTTENSIFGQQAAAPSTIAFGQTSLTTSASSGKLFGAASAKTAGNAPSPFGATVGQANGQSQNTGFQFGVTAPTKTATSVTPAFQFGGSAPTTTASTTVQASPFAFGAQAPSATTNKPGVITFGQATSTAPSAFGTATTATNNAFGVGGSLNAFGSGNMNSPFGTGANTNNPSPAFGQPAVQSTQNAFGVDAHKTGGAFGSTGSMAQPAFNAATTGAFGAGQQQPQQPATGGFGMQQKAQSSKGFDFSASTKPTLNFGGAPQPTQPAPQQSGFAFGAANNQANSGFNFNTGSSNAFGITAPSTPQMGSQTPAFGTPNTNPTATPNPFSPPTTPGQGGFTIGSGNVQPRPRSVVRAARRRTTKR